ncbi:MAG: hypothetical protein WBS20_02095 [Lysobacterales bacterium]
MMGQKPGATFFQAHNLFLNFPTRSTERILPFSTMYCVIEQGTKTDWHEPGMPFYAGPAIAREAFRKFVHFGLIPAVFGRKLRA